MADDEIGLVTGEGIGNIEGKRGFKVVVPCVLRNSFLGLVIRRRQAARKNTAGNKKDNNATIHDHWVKPG